MGFKCQKQKPPNPPKQDSPVPHMPCKQTLWPPTQGPSGTQWLEDLFCEPSQYNEPLIAGLSQSSKSQVPSNEDALTCAPEPEVAPMQSTENPFACAATPCSIIILDNMPVGAFNPTLAPSPEIPPISPRNPTASSPHSHNEVQQELTNLKLTLMIP
ncbi:hypothetical protein O181_038795 [Austropuccinia psidii MF-1]|uniref:Uncharacterized protein n=1 Tax=Austropuccinia psidii MF-1 TaxID=1389203 RepID=A0A9Q3DAE7_9BASI|nr:hypothetical protein [Austropuccinia psidii MF-1]